MSREECVAYADRHGIKVEATKKKIYSIDENLWGRAIECGEIEDPWAAPPDDAYVLTRPTATEPSELVIGFERGVPVRWTAGHSLDALIGEVGSIVGVLGLGATRHGREPEGRDKEPRDLPVPGGSRPPRRIGTSRTSPSSATWPTRRSVSNRDGRLRLRRALVLASQRRARLVLLHQPAARHRRGAPGFSPVHGPLGEPNFVAAAS